MTTLYKTIDHIEVDHNRWVLCKPEKKSVQNIKKVISYYELKIRYNFGTNEVPQVGVVDIRLPVSDNGQITKGTSGEDDDEVKDLTKKMDKYSILQHIDQKSANDMIIANILNGMYISLMRQFEAFKVECNMQFFETRISEGFIPHP